MILEEASRIDHCSTTHRVRQPQLSLTVDLNNASTLFALEERIVAAESLIFFGTQVEAMRHYFTSLMSDDGTKQSLDRFYCHVVHLAVDMRKPIFTAAMSKIFISSDVLPLIHNVNWEQEDVACQHSCYIDFIFRVK